MPVLLKTLLIAAACCIVSLFFGMWVATESYTLIILLAVTVVAAAVVVIPGYSFLLAFGILCPFALSLPFVYGMPALGLLLGLIGFKYVFRRSLSDRMEAQRLRILTIPIIMFFGWVLFRYCLNPALPGVAVGIGEGVTGFRSYLNYVICFFLLFAMAFFLRTRADVTRILRWFRSIAIVFTLALTPLIFTKSAAVSAFLNQFGMYVTSFDNGFLRFVVLPDFGVILLLLGLLPNILPVRRPWRIALICLGFSAIVLGGNRSTFAAALIIVCCIPWLKRDFLRSASIAGAVVVALAAFYFIGQNVRMPNTGVFRVLSIASSNVAESTDAAATYEWRKIRWAKAWELIRQHPVIGKGYGGLDRIFMPTNYEQFEEARLEIDLANGGIHNGYLASAMHLGIPATALFVLVLGSLLIFNWSRARFFLTRDPMISDLHCFAFASLVSIGIWIYIGADLNAPSIWFYCGLGLVVAQIKKRELAAGSIKQDEQVGLDSRPLIQV